MGIFQPDLIHYTAFKAALADLRANKFLLNDAYSDMINDPLLSAYGAKEVERLKAFIDKEIYVTLETRMPDVAKFPYIVISLGQGSEDSAKDALGDSYQSELIDPASLGGAIANSTQILLGPVTPLEYDSMTGQITFDPSVSLTASNIYAGQFVYDSKNNKSYEILLVLDDSNLLIAEGLNPTLTNMYIKPQRMSMSNIRRSVWVWENHTIKIGATDSTELMYLFTLVVYILMRYKKTLWDARNFAVATIGYSEIYAVSSQDDPNITFGRDIHLRGRVEHSVIESTSPIIYGTNLELDITGMGSAPDAPYAVKEPLNG